MNTTASDVDPAKLISWDDHRHAVGPEIGDERQDPFELNQKATDAPV
jgi:hypothetical protein